MSDIFILKPEERFLNEPKMTRFEDATSDDYKQCANACNVLAKLAMEMHSYAKDLNAHALISEGAFKMCAAVEDDLTPYNIDQLKSILRNLTSATYQINDCTNQIKEMINAITRAEGATVDEAFMQNFEKFPIFDNEKEEN